MEAKKIKSHCPVNYALELFGDKWSLLIIRDILFEGKSYYCQFLESKEKISTNILANRLSRLEKAGILQKNQDEENKTRYIYSLTPKGVDLLPVLVEMMIWSAQHDPATTFSTDEMDQLLNDKEAFINGVLASFTS